MPSTAPLDWSRTPEGLALSARIAEALVGEIRRGRFRPGARLPGSRTLAQQCGVHRGTIVTAYEELIAQGYAETKVGSGTYVVPTMQRIRPRQVSRGGTSGPYRGKPATLRLDVSPPASTWGELPAGTLPLLGGLPELRHVPRAALARAYRAALKSAPLTLDYRSARSEPRFSEQLRSYLSEMRGVVAAEDELLTTRGSQQALHLAGRVLHRPGSVIVVERCGYPPAWEGFRLAGARLLPVSTDRHGLRVDRLAQICQLHDVAAVYVTPHHQYPTTVTLSGPRRLALLRLAHEHDFVVIEDDYDHEYHFEGRPILPVHTADEEGRVLLVGTFSKVLAPGLRLGFAVGQAPLIEAMTRHRTFIDRQGDHVLERAIAIMLEDGELQAHIRRMHRLYRVRRQVLFDELERQLGDVLSFSRPNGGLAVWCRAERSISTNAWGRAARHEGVLVQQAAPFFFDRRERPYLRVGYARLDEPKLKEAVRRLKRALSQAR